MSRICRNCGALTVDPNAASEGRVFSVAPRSGKYYGTVILYGDQPIGRIWHHEELDHPSRRELSYLSAGMTEDEFWEGCCDSQWESQSNYEEATRLVELLNRTLKQ